MAKQGHYRQAHKIKTTADQMEEIEMATTQASFEAEFRAKQHIMLTKQQQELQALTQK